MRYFVEVTQNEAEVLEENGTVTLDTGSSGGKIVISNPDDAPWLLLKSNLVTGSSHGNS